MYNNNHDEGNIKKYSENLQPPVGTGHSPNRLGYPSSDVPSGELSKKRNSMPKRLTDTAKWRDPWFRKLSPELKCLWNYICDDCDLTGVWKCDFEMASFIIGKELTDSEAFSLLNSGKERIIQLYTGYWLINDFISFQYGVLGFNSPIHKKVISLIESHRVSIGYPMGIDTLSIPCNKNKKENNNKDLKDISKTKPSDLLEVKQFFKNDTEANKFWNHFQSNGWKVGGKAPMKDWQAAARNWISRSGELNKQATVSKSRVITNTMGEDEMRRRAKLLQESAKNG